MWYRVMRKKPAQREEKKSETEIECQYSRWQSTRAIFPRLELSQWPWNGIFIDVTLKMYLQLGKVLYSARVPAINHTVVHRHRLWATMATLAVAAALVAMIRSTSSNRILTNWKLISTTERFTYDVANVLLPYQRQTKALLWIMAMRWHAREKWVPQK